MAINASKPNQQLTPGRQGSGVQQPQTGLVRLPNQPQMLVAPVKERMQAFFDAKPEVKKGERATISIEATRTGALEILPQLASHFGVNPTSDELISRAALEARDKGVTITEMLDMMDPAEYYAGTPLGEMDGFQRQLFLAGIRTKSVPEKGIYADQINRFFQSNVPGSQVLFPEFINRVMRQSMIAPDILPYIIATTTGVQGSYYRTIYTNDTVASRRMYRVGQGAELPKTTLASAEHDINLYKYGRLLEGSYEYFRTVSIDLFSILLQRIALQANLDKADAAIDVAINGDGNSNSATNYNQSTLDTGTSPTYKAFIKFALKFWPYKLTALVGGETAFVNFLSMARPSVDPYQILSVLQNGQTFDTMRVQLAQNIYTDVKLIYLSSVTANLLVGLDTRFALEMVVENGANLVETDRLISSQRNQVAISEKVGFGQIFNQAVATWATAS